MTIEESVQKASAGVKSLRIDLRAVKHQYRGREAEYLEHAKIALYTSIEWAREVLIREIGYDIKEQKHLSSLSIESISRGKKTYLMLLERTALDAIAIGKAVARTMEVAERNDRDPILEGYEAFFWACENVYSAGTIFLMLDFEGDEKQAMTILMSGWMDALLEVNGQQALRLIAGLGVSQEGVRQALRRELPSAVLQAAEEWQPGKELFTNDVKMPKPGKKTMGRRSRSFKSRVSRRIELLADSKPSALLSKAARQNRDWQSEASITMAKPISVKATDQGDLILKQWKRLVSRARLRGNELEIATYVASSPECLTVGSGGRLKLKYGSQLTIAKELNRPPNQIRQESMRMFKKIKKAQHEMISARSQRE